MQLNNLIHWRLQGTPDVFTEKRDGHTWQVIDSGKPYHAGLSQTVYFDRPIKRVTLLARASLFTRLRSLMVRIGLQDLTEEDYNPQSPNVFWGFWEGPDNGWKGEPKTLQISWVRETKRLAVFLEGVGRWPVKNVCRWRDARLEVEYLDIEPEPEPPDPPEPDPDPEPPDPDPEPPEPEPDFPEGDPRRWAVQRMREIQQETIVLVETSKALLDEVHNLAATLGLTEEERVRAMEWVNTYNKNKFKRTPMIGD